MKYLFIAIALIAFSACTFGQKHRFPVKVLDATSQHWVSGAPGGRTGTNYSIKILIQTNRKVEFTGLWLGEKNVPFNIEFYKQVNPVQVRQGDSILITSNIINGEDSPDFVNKTVPCRYKGSALIKAKVNGRTRFFIVPNIRKLDPFLGM